MHSRRDLLSGLAAFATLSALWPTRSAFARGPFDVQLQLSLEMAKAYQLNGQGGVFRRLFDVQHSFLGLSWPSTDIVVTDAMSALRRVLDGEVVPRVGFRHARREAMRRTVVFSDHHIVPDRNRQSGVWRANRDAYVRLLDHYGSDGWLVVENGDVEDLVIVDPEDTLDVYETLLRSRGHRLRAKKLIAWYREDPDGLVEALHAGRLANRQRQLEEILEQRENRAYYDKLRELAANDQLVRLAGNHDYSIQELVVGAEHLVPIDILLLGEEPHAYALMHGHQFDQATNPGVAPIYGEVVSECLGVWYQGPDRLWNWQQAQRILHGGFPNRLATHHGGHRAAGIPASFLTALLTSSAADDEEWATAWESLFGHPIAWEYGAPDWESAIQGHLARPKDLIDDAMTGRQFFKFRHLDEWSIMRVMHSWDIDVGLVLGHSHEVRHHTSGRGRTRYFNSGAAGRFERLIWALELTDTDTVEVVGWFIQDDGAIERVVFDKHETELTSYFRPSTKGPRTRLGGDA